MLVEEVSGYSFVCLTPESKAVRLSTNSIAVTAGPVESLTGLRRLTPAEYEIVSGSYAEAVEAFKGEIDEIASARINYRMFPDPLSCMAEADESDLKSGLPAVNQISPDSIKQSPYVVRMITDARRNTLRRKIENELGIRGFKGPVCLPEEVVIPEDDTTLAENSYW